ncbi:hypothetical protein CHGG_04070 [Chaetomium globosum CBS 148.51]|uniref:DUF3669 domain-containing protein n=1 Tax=Chaetomium globosum (strain ATCC 6205 / CBS 148.51 / DSM 1962 / NBRC 6347 / NRRL 1970) TaxID=306901 RepID=Q2H2C6_CHAGB|nr:uncharacterized protein CHGG_04070 [Chaetomium globosum CBS 148.51]EAQ87451.1 hypothetical protein CHGG_04070 [Chaetomium globosum CBS 148.51]
MDSLKEISIAQFDAPLERIGIVSESELLTGFQFYFPRHIQFLQPGTPSWNDILPRLPPESVVCQALISERILPLPRDIRRVMVDNFWNGRDDLRDSIINDKRNEHCLIRPYLGRRRVHVGTGAGERRSMFKSISLRNYPLHIDQMEALGLPTHEYASAMADALAFLLWVAKIDACDVEFVLARPRAVVCAEPSRLGRGASPRACSALMPCGFSILTAAGSFPCLVNGIRLAAERFWRNDPFYPNPDAKCEEDKALWEDLKTGFSPRVER